MRINYNYWSRDYEKCRECATNKIKYGGLGLCRSCYSRIRRKDGKKKTSFEQSKLRRDKYFFGGYRNQYIKENSICVICGSKKDLIVHHKSGKRKNGDPEDFETLCRKCHTKWHNFLRLKQFFEIYLNRN